MGTVLLNLVILILGVFIGGILVYSYAHWNMEARRQDKVVRDRALLRENIKRIRHEIEHNMTVLNKLHQDMDHDKLSRPDHLRKCAAHVDTISSFAFNYLNGTQLNILLPMALESLIFDTYNALEGLKKQYIHTLNMQEPFGNQEDPQTLHQEFSLLFAHINDVSTILEKNLKQIEAYWRKVEANGLHLLD
ncbi:hypothetical protein [Marinicrinis lubricantis]|uniref:Uncharacterized protein n=1 Tax=Marinicrinis lubricantis TaxID=2086470 RepID=A0ABW1IPC4_9BACL